MESLGSIFFWPQRWLASVWWRAWSWKFCYPDAMKVWSKPLALGLNQEWDLAVRLVGPSISAQTGSIRGQSSGQQLLLRGRAYNKDGRSLLLLWQQNTQFLWVNENQHCLDTWGFILSLEAQGIWRVHSKWLLSLGIFLTTTYNGHKIIITLIIIIIMNFITINIFMTFDSFAKDFLKAYDVDIYPLLSKMWELRLPRAPGHTGGQWWVSDSSSVKCLQLLSSPTPELPEQQET